MSLDGRHPSRISSSTAQSAAALRAAASKERDSAVRNPDHLAPKMIEPGLSLTVLSRMPVFSRFTKAVAERIAPGSYYYETGRTRYMDDVVRAEAERGVRQIVILGAGYDTRAYRLGLDGVRFFEVDHPFTARKKRERLIRAFGAVPSHVTYVEVDFESEDLGERLTAHGYSAAEPALFVWSGVAIYLPEEAVDAVLRFVALQADGSSIVFDYAYQEYIDGDDSFYGAAELRKRVEDMGEPFRSGIPRGQAARYLEERGLALESDMGREELAPRYLVKSDGSAWGRPYEFGGIAHARTGPARHSMPRLQGQRMSSASIAEEKSKPGVGPPSTA